MKIKPVEDLIIGRIVDVAESRGGIFLPRTSVTGVTALMRVDAVGPKVTRCQPGDTIAYRRMWHMMLRDGTYSAWTADEDVMGVVTELEERWVVGPGLAEGQEAGPVMVDYLTQDSHEQDGATGTS